MSSCGLSRLAPTAGRAHRRSTEPPGGAVRPVDPEEHLTSCGFWAYIPGDSRAQLGYAGTIQAGLLSSWSHNKLSVRA